VERERATITADEATSGAPTARADSATEASPYLNRELSWLAFNRRVLEEALDERAPLLERVKFLAIVGTNLDEFFMIRVAGIKQQVAAGVATRSPDGMTPAEQLIAIRQVVESDIATQRRCWLDDLRPRLRAHRDLGPAQRARRDGPPARDGLGDRKHPRGKPRCDQGDPARPGAATGGLAVHGRRSHGARGHRGLEVVASGILSQAAPPLGAMFVLMALLSAGTYFLSCALATRCPSKRIRWVGYWSSCCGRTIWCCLGGLDNA